MNTRISEPELILPSLYLMSSAGGTISTSDLIKKLRLIMKPTGEDTKILTGRNDDKFSQKVRNLKAHDTFEKLEYARYEGGARAGHFEITLHGEQHLEQNKEIIKYLLENDFANEDLSEKFQEVEENKNKRKIETFDENVIIQEGTKEIAATPVYKRSSKLRNYAIEHFTEKDGRINCKCCTFNFSDFYGKDIGEGFIEIHHAKPIFKYEDDDFEKTLEHALKNLTPVCSNCHRMIHRKWNKPIEVQTLIENINANGVFDRQ